MTESKKPYDLYEFEKYEDYITAQMEHERTKYRTANRPFLAYLDKIKKVFPNAKKVLCVGARDVSEVQAFRDHGYEAIGIDLFSDDETTVRILDMHNLKSDFSENEFDLVYSCHSLEHSYDPEKVMQGFEYVSKMGAFIVLPFHIDADHKDPLVLPFMKVGGRPKQDGDKATVTDVTFQMVQKDFNDLLNSQFGCNVLDVLVYPFYPRWDDGYWVSIGWIK